MRPLDFLGGATAALVLAGCGSAPAPDPGAAPMPTLACLPGEHAVVGRVIDEPAGRPLAGALVRVEGTLPRTQGAVTDSTGWYTLLRVPSGYLNVQAVKVGYYIEQRPIAFQGGGVVGCPASGCEPQACTPDTLNFYMRPARVLLET